MINSPAVLMIVFNRPELTQRTLEALDDIKPAKLYVAADGPRNGNSSDLLACQATRALFDNLSWSCDVKCQFQSRNRGCRYTVANAISWFLGQEEAGIILEDDCVPSKDFFSYCRCLLDYYRADDRVMAISGNNFQNGIQRGDGSYYLSKYVHIWGWATWRRAWSCYDNDLSFWPALKLSEKWNTLHPNKREREFWEDLLQQVADGKIDSWGYPWLASIWANSGCSITPNQNLVTNIGFDDSATHTKDSSSPFAGMDTGSLGPLVHPSSLDVCAPADKYTFRRNYRPDLAERIRRKWRKLAKR